MNNNIKKITESKCTNDSNNNKILCRFSNIKF